jgi:hypothetical protein
MEGTMAIEQRSVSPELASMASADAAKQQTVTTAQKRGLLQKLIDKAFEANAWAELTKLSGQMVALENTEKRENAAKLEAKLLSELADENEGALSMYLTELTPYTEIRLHLSEGVVKGITLMDIVAPARTSKTATTSAPKSIDRNGFETDSHGLPTSASLLVKYGDTIVDEKDSRTFKVAMAEAKGKKNPLFQLRTKLLKVAGY